MFKHWPKRTKVLVGIFSGVFVVAVAIGIWAGGTGKLGTKADTYIFPGTSGGKLIGTISPVGVCTTKLSSTYITLYRNSNHTQLAQVKSDSSGHFEFRNVPLNIAIQVGGGAWCSNGMVSTGQCGWASNSAGNIITFTSNGQIINKTFRSEPAFGIYKILTKVRNTSITNQTQCINAGGTWNYSYCLVKLPYVDLKIVLPGGTIKTGIKTDSNGAWPGSSPATWAKGDREPYSINVTASKTGYTTTSAQSNIKGCTSQLVTVELRKN